MASTPDIVKTGPEHLRLSLAAAMTLNLRPGSFYRDARLRCLNLLLSYPEGCLANCAYCGLSRTSGNGSAGSFIRVEWPEYPVTEIIARARNCPGLERICISMIMHPHAFADTINLTHLFSRELNLPVSVLANPTTMGKDAIRQLYDCGADMVSIALDAATLGIFVKLRGKDVKGPHKWDNYWSSLREAALVLGKDKAGCHLIAGLGETELEMAETIQLVRDLGARTHLFSFYPEAGSLLEDANPCPASQFRRIQLARFLIDCGLTDASAMEFDERGRIAAFGLEQQALDELVDSGEPFMTSGCPGRSGECACNRPYGDGPPSDIRSYPFKPERSDLRQIRKELSTYLDV